MDQEGQENNSNDRAAAFLFNLHVGGPQMTTEPVAPELTPEQMADQQAQARFPKTYGGGNGTPQNFGEPLNHVEAQARTRFPTTFKTAA